MTKFVLGERVCVCVSKRESSLLKWFKRKEQIAHCDELRGFIVKENQKERKQNLFLKLNTCTTPKSVLPSSAFDFQYIYIYIYLFQSDGPPKSGRFAVAFA